MNSTEVRVRIIHETNPQKYFPALIRLADEGRVSLVGMHRYSVVKEWFRAWLRERRPLRARTIQSLEDLLLRARLPVIKNEVVVLGMAPWDWRVLLYSVLARRNKLIYHTSWPYWETHKVPRQYGILTEALRRRWLKLLCHPNVRVVAVLGAARNELDKRFGIEAELIPHSVDEAFYAAARNRNAVRGTSLRLVFVGELSRKKGIEQTLKLMECLRDVPVGLMIIGDGPLRARCIAAAEKNPAIEFIGPVRDRMKLASLMASNDVLVLLSQREASWEELFGIVIAEAMAAGLGVIASDHIGPHSLVADAGLPNLFRDGDVNGPLSLILELARDSSFLAKFCVTHAGLAEEFRQSSVANQWAQVIYNAQVSD